MQRAVLYLRSSKDRHDVSIESQRRELTALAAGRGYVVAGEFVDEVESGKDDDRPGLQGLLAELHRRERTWSTVLTLDTSRIARRAAAAYWFEDRECRPRGVSVVYKNLPDMEEAERAIVKAVFHGVDEWHSLVSKRKGMAGMRENVRAGWRAGGRAPLGYQLEHVATGKLREGKSVTKSRLVASSAAPAIAAFLRDRAAGVPRFRAAKLHGLQHLEGTTLLGMERNALTYAGQTLWNRLAEPGRIGARRKPREEWEVRRDTHEALITEAEALAILAQLERRAKARTQQKKHTYLLSGLLCAPSGAQWHGDRDRYSRFYRHPRARRILSRRVDQAVLGRVAQDLAGGELAKALIESMRRHLLGGVDPKRLAAARRKVSELDGKIRRLAELASTAETPAPLLRTMTILEHERTTAIAAAELLEREAASDRALRSIDEDQVRQGLRNLAVDLETAGGNDDEIRDVLLQFLERVELDPEAPDEVVLHYRPPAGVFTGVQMASPQGLEPHSGGLKSRVKLAA